jgi:exodeoxyribonuclease-3
VRIATWNVNSIRSRIDRVEAFLDRHEIDVLAVQETKAKVDQLPTMGLEARGYGVAAVGHSQWNGVALISRVGLDDVTVGFEGMPLYGDPEEAEARAISAVCGGVRVVSLYVPNGRKPGDPHYRYKLDWLARLRDASQAWLAEPTALVGDWNVCPYDEDCFDPHSSRTRPI